MGCSQHEGEAQMPDVLSDAYFCQMRDAARTRVPKKRFAHMKGVAKTAEELARAYGVDPARARLAGILHDWDKGLDNDQIRCKVKELGIEDEVSSWVVANMPQVVHGPTAAAELAREHPEIPADVLSAIWKHTIASSEMTELDKIIYIADALEPGRSFDEVGDLRAMMGVASLDELYLEVYRFWIQTLIGMGGLLHPDTLAIWNALIYPEAHERLLRYEKRCKERKA